MRWVNFIHSFGYLYSILRPFYDYSTEETILPKFILFYSILFYEWKLSKYSKRDKNKTERWHERCCHTIFFRINIEVDAISFLPNVQQRVWSNTVNCNKNITFRDATLKPVCLRTIFGTRRWNNERSLELAN